MSDESQKRNSTLRIVFRQTVVALAVTLLLLAPCAALVSVGAIPLNGILPLVLLTQGVGVLIGSRGAARRANGRRLVVGVCVALCLFAFVLAGGVLFAYPPGGNALFSAFVILLCGALGGVWGAQPKKKHRT